MADLAAGTKGIMNAAQKMGLGQKALGYAKKNPLGVWAGVGFLMDVSYEQKQGSGFGASVAKAAVQNALLETNPVLMTAAQLAPLAIQGAVAAHQFRRTKEEERFDAKHNGYGRIGGNYLDTMQAQTMRQAAVQQIQGNKLNARSALGGEARIFANTVY